MGGAPSAQGTTAAAEAMLSEDLTNGLSLIHTPKGASLQTHFAYEAADNAPAECRNTEAAGIFSKLGTTLNNSALSRTLFSLISYTEAAV